MFLVSAISLLSAAAGLLGQRLLVSFLGSLQTGSSACLLGLKAVADDLPESGFLGSLDSLEACFLGFRDPFGAGFLGSPELLDAGSFGCCCFSGLSPLDFLDSLDTCSLSLLDLADAGLLGFFFDQETTALGVEAEATSVKELIKRDASSRHSVACFV